MLRSLVSDPDELTKKWMWSEMIGNALQYENLVRQAHSLLAQQNHVDARSACRHLLKINKNSPEAFRFLAEMDWKESKRDDAIARLKKYLQMRPGDDGARIMIGEWLRTSGRAKEAVPILKKLLQRAPSHPYALAGLARCYSVLNQNDRALEILRTSVDTPVEHFATARAYQSIQKECKNFEEAIRVGSHYANDARIDAAIRAEFLMELGQCYEKLDRFDEALDCYNAANNVSALPYDIEELNARVRGLMNVFSPERVAALPRAVADPGQMVFIISRPRSGSTLVGRILASHPQVAAMGENTFVEHIVRDLPLVIGSTLSYPEAIADLDKNDVAALSEQCTKTIGAVDSTAARITNKHLSNWKHLGLVQLLLPNARVIDLRRDPADTCIACYSSLLWQSASSYDLRRLAFAQRAHEALMDHWKATLELSILSLNYEDLVTDRETWIRRLIDFCGLPWDDACLRFYESGESKQQSVDPTLSYNQVREPMHTSSVGRAKRFGARLQPLYEALEEGQRIWN